MFDRAYKEARTTGGRTGLKIRRKVRSTRPHRPLSIAYIEEVDSRSEALKREKYYKSSFGRRRLNKFFVNAEMAELVDAPDSKSGEAQTS